MWSILAGREAHLVIELIIDLMEIDSPKDIIEAGKKEAASSLLEGFADLQDSFAVDVMGNSEMSENEKGAFDYAAQALVSFIDSNPKFIGASPRSIRELDRKRILPGQHGGISAAFSLEDGTILRLNFYGGLRIVTSADTHDADSSLARSHTRRTDSVLGQITHLNWQLSLPGGPALDSWMIHNPDNNGTFQQSSLIIDGQDIECQPAIKNGDTRFNQLKEHIFNPINKLVDLVPSSV